MWQCPIIRGVEGNAYTQYTFHITQPCSIDFLPATAGYSGKAHCRNQQLSALTQYFVFKEY